jgi:NDP-sugar pyrophosphorylase family protein
MDAVILAAGRGSRMGALTDEVCKPMLPLRDGKPLLEHIFKTLPKRVDRVILITGYKGELIREYFGGGFGDISVEYKQQDINDSEMKGTWPALCLAKDALLENQSTSFLLLNADDLFDKGSLEKLAESRNGILIGEVESLDAAKRFGVVVVEDGKMKEIEEKPDNPKSMTVSVGAYVFDNCILLEDNPAKRGNGEMVVPDVLESFKKENVLDAVLVKEWKPIGTEEEYRNELLKKEERNGEGDNRYEK